MKLCSLMARSPLGLGDTWSVYLYPLFWNPQKPWRSYLIRPFRYAGQLEDGAHSQYAALGKQTSERVLGVQPSQELSQAHGEQFHGRPGEVHP